MTPASSLAGSRSPSPSHRRFNMLIRGASDSKAPLHADLLPPPRAPHLLPASPAPLPPSSTRGRETVKRIAVRQKHALRSAAVACRDMPPSTHNPPWQLSASFGPVDPRKPRPLVFDLSEIHRAVLKVETPFQALGRLLLSSLILGWEIPRAGAGSCS